MNKSSLPKTLLFSTREAALAVWQELQGEYPELEWDWSNGLHLPDEQERNEGEVQTIFDITYSGKFRKCVEIGNFGYCYSSDSCELDRSSGIRVFDFPDDADYIFSRCKGMSSWLLLGRKAGSGMRMDGLRR